MLMQYECVVKKLEKIDFRQDIRSNSSHYLYFISDCNPISMLVLTVESPNICFSKAVQESLRRKGIDLDIFNECEIDFGF
ncbi:MAG: hypothetical protein ATN35_01580 [Epulopiscium sp. Nele67-Bin004]|nr:MAG: hypothetical protein ATN35_01580 [Epulopiscium sp. Nele67-Bin004]